MVPVPGRPNEKRTPMGWQSVLYILVIVSLTVLAASGMSGWHLAVLITLAALALVASLLRRVVPYALLAVAWVTTAFATQVLLVPALFNLGVRRRGWRGWLGVGATVLLFAAAAPRGERLVSIDGVDHEAWIGLASWTLNCIVVVVLPYVIGTAVANRRDLTDNYRIRAEHAEAQKSARETEAVLLERARIAREAHDVLGHKLSLVTMQAGGLELNASAGPKVVAEHAQLIRRSARDALDDLRAIIGSLEPLGELDSSATTRSLVPQSVLGINELVAESRSSGAKVNLATSKLVRPELLPERSSRAAFRVIQEGLTNAYRHAPGAPVSVSLVGEAGKELVIEIRNTVAYLDNPDSDLGPGGRGLPGLNERVRSVGGDFSAQESGSVFIVVAKLPWPTVPEALQGEPS